MSNSINLSLHGISCCSCLAAVEEAVSKESHVQKVEIDPDTLTACVETDLRASHIIAAIKAAGYDATKI